MTAESRYSYWYVRESIRDSAVKPRRDAEWGIPKRTITEVIPFINNHPNLKVFPWLACPAEREGPREPVFPTSAIEKVYGTPRSGRGETAVRGFPGFDAKL